MATVRDIVARALRKISVIDGHDAPDADEMAAGVDALNEMLAAWELSSVDVSHTALAAGDTFPLAAKFEEGTIYNLAARMSPEYIVPVGFDADDFFRKIQAAYSTLLEVDMPAALTSMPSRYDRGL